METILVTGAAGFIGSHVVDRLLNNSCAVVGVDNLSTGNQRNLEDAYANDRFQFLKIDIRSLRGEDMRQVDAVFHFAAAKIPRYGDRLNTIHSNIETTKAALDIAKKYQCRFIFASTSDVYGKNQQPPFAEISDSVLGASVSARWSYAVSKLAGEHLCFGYAEEYQVPVVVIRYFGVYGPREALGWWGGAQSAFIEAALDGKPLEVHGDGKQTRCLAYIDDIIRGTIAVLEGKKPTNEIINLGGTQEVRMIDLAKQICRLLGYPFEKSVRFVPYSQLPSREYQDVRRRVPDLKKAQELLSYKPRILLREGLPQTIAWHKSLRGG